MFEHYTLGTQLQSSGARVEVEEPPIDPIAVPPPSELPSEHRPPPNATSPTTAANETSPSAKNLDRLAHRMSKQSLRLDFTADVPLPLATRIPSPLSATSMARPPPTHIPDAPPLEADDDADLDFEMDLVFGEPEEQSGVDFDPTRKRRQRDSLFHNNPSNMPAIRSLAAGMILPRSRYDYPSTSTPKSSDVGMAPPYVAAEEDPVVLACNELEVDEGFCDEDLEDWRDNFTVTEAMRKSTAAALGYNLYAAAPAGVRKRYPHLKYRSSHDAALNCPTIVRNVPRMRRRRGEKSSRSSKSTASKTSSSLPQTPLSRPMDTIAQTPPLLAPSSITLDETRR